MCMKILLIRNRISILSIGFLFFFGFLSAQTIDWSMKANPEHLSINSVAFRADGIKVLSGTNCHPASIRMFDVASANLDWDYNVGFTYMCIMGVSFSSNTNYIAAIEEFGNIFIFDNTGPLPKIIDTIDTGTSYAFSTAIAPSNDKVAVGCSNGKLKIYNIATGNLLNDINAHSSWVTSVAYSLDGNKIVTGGNDDKVKVWSNSGNLLLTCSGHTDDITNVKVTPDNKFVVSSSKDDKIKIWNILTGEMVQSITGHRNDINGIDISPDGSKIVSASSDSTCKIWNLQTGKLLANFGVPDSGEVYTVAWSPYGDKIATGNRLSDLTIWNVSKIVNSSDNHSFHEFTAFPNPACNHINFNLPFQMKNLKINVFNQYGQILQAKYIISDDLITVDTRHFPNGIYYFLLQHDSRKYSGKFFVNK